MYFKAMWNFRFIFGYLFGFGISSFVLQMNHVLRYEGTYQYLHNSKNDAPNTGLLFVGVISSKKFLSTRAQVLYDTWGKDVPGMLKFFIGGPTLHSSEIPIVNLAIESDDLYPPVEKQFAIMQYMCDHHLKDFQWFMRCDDDNYVKTHELHKFLLSLDSSKRLYIGQTGYGHDDVEAEFAGKAFCMGGSGVILSRALMKDICPYLDLCFNKVKLTYDDAELGRCIIATTGIQCTRAKDSQNFFYHDYEKGTVYKNDLSKYDFFSKALTLHPAKDVAMMKNIHHHYNIMRHGSASTVKEFHKVIQHLKNTVKMDPKSGTSPDAVGLYSDALLQEFWNKTGIGRNFGNCDIPLISSVDVDPNKGITYFINVIHINCNKFHTPNLTAYKVFTSFNKIIAIKTPTIGSNIVKLISIKDDVLRDINMMEAENWRETMVCLCPKGQTLSEKFRNSLSWKLDTGKLHCLILADTVEGNNNENMDFGSFIFRLRDKYVNKHGSHIMCCGFKDVVMRELQRQNPVDKVTKENRWTFEFKKVPSQFVDSFFHHQLPVK